MGNQKIVGLIMVCTGSYDVFIQPLIDSADKHFFKEERVDIYLLSDNDYDIIKPDRFDIHRFEVPYLLWPFPSLYRYRWMTQHADEITSKNLFYMDIDMLFMNTVDKEILPINDNLVATLHPGYFRGGWGDHGTSALSTAYLEPEKRHSYFAGGFQGGSRDSYLNAAEHISKNIDIDLAKARTLNYTDNDGVLAHWFDESHWNHYLKHTFFDKLTPEYCMVEEMELRKNWGIDHLTPRIIALKKDHKKIRT